MSVWQFRDRMETEDSYVMHDLGRGTDCIIVYMPTGSSQAQVQTLGDSRTLVSPFGRCRKCCEGVYCRYDGD